MTQASIDVVGIGDAEGETVTRCCSLGVSL
jgi:hypothetical protein